jgi:hypothetical protein
MTFSLTSVFALLVHLSASGISSDTELPKTWTKEFTISLSYTGSMDGSSTHLTFTYDSCIYIKKTGMKAPKKTFFLLQESDRTEILKKMHELHADKIQSEMSIAPVNDGYSATLCVGHDCVQGGTSVTMSDQDKEQFSMAYDYLEEYAIKKAKKKG